MASRSGSGGSSSGSRTGQKAGSAGSASRGAGPGSAGSGRTGKPSDKLNPKTIDPFNTSSRGKSAFAQVYANGGVPCRLVHGSVKHRLTWTVPIEEVPFDPVLVTLAEGIRETVHPYSFVARQGFQEMMDTDGASHNVVPLLPKLASPIRAALNHNEGAVFEAGLRATVQLSDVVGPAINHQLKSLLVPIAKKMMDKKYRESVTESLHQLEQNGGKEALLLIKAKIPTYTSINF